MKRILPAGLALVMVLGACKKAAPPPLYLAVPVTHRNIIVPALASGAVDALTVVHLKAPPRGTIPQFPAPT